MNDTMHEIARTLRNDPRIGIGEPVTDATEQAIMSALRRAIFVEKDEDLAIKSLAHALIDLAPANSVLEALFFITHWTADGGAE